jgi:hypothetical protein
MQRRFTVQKNVTLPDGQNATPAPISRQVWTLSELNTIWFVLRKDTLSESFVVK